MSALSHSPSDSEHDASVTALIESVQPRLRAFLVSLTGSGVEADDLAQETNLVLWEKRDEFEAGSNFQAWAFQIAYFQARNHRRRSAKQSRREIPSEELLKRISDESQIVAKRDPVHRHALAACLAKLKRADRDLIMRRYITGLDLSILSAETGSNPNALSQRLFRLRQNLLQCVTRQLRPHDSHSESSMP